MRVPSFLKYAGAETGFFRFVISSEHTRAFTGLTFGVLGTDNPHRNRREIMSITLTEPEIVTRKGKPVSVILPIKDYEELLERTEDVADVAWLKQARRQPLRYRPLADYLAERKTRRRV